MTSRNQMLEDILTFETPLLRDRRDDRILLKLEGGGLCMSHKYRSAAWILNQLYRSGNLPDKIADRSSGSWAMGLAWAAGLFSIPTRFVTVTEPAPYVRAMVEACGGEFDLVEDNPKRIEAVKNLEVSGYFVPDQHNNPEVINAFEHTVGTQIIRQLTQGDYSFTHLVAPVGTGGVLAGIARALKKAGYSFCAVGVDLTSSIVHGGPRADKYPFAVVRGVGSDDEHCGTLAYAEEFIDSWVIAGQFEALKEASEFIGHYPFSIGLSSALAYCAAKKLLQTDRHCRPLVIMPDRGETYASELRLANCLFGTQPFRRLSG